MGWHTSLQRLRLVGTAALVLGVLACISVFATRGLGYAPDTSVEPLFTALWPIGLVLAALGALIWVAVWVLLGSAAPAAAPLQPGLAAAPRHAHLEDARPGDAAETK